MKKAFPLALLLATASLFTSFVHAQTIVCVETNLDTFCMQMENDHSVAAANFLHYVDKGAYDNTFIHQSVRNGYLAGGVWQASLTPVQVATDAPVKNLFTTDNVSRKVALLSVPGQPGSATSGWRINVADNSSIFTGANGGAVFADILANPVNGDGMDVVNRLAKLPVYKIPTTNGFLDQAPLLKLDNKITADDVAQVKRMYRYGGTIDDFNANGIIHQPELSDVVCMTTNLGDLCYKLFPDPVDGAPKTVANFLQYVRAGDYDNTIFHRYATGFVMQGGAYRFTTSGTETDAVAVQTRPSVVNEYGIPNTFATIAMAKQAYNPADGTGGPNSATNQFFINLGDNTSTLNPANNGGFTVFGELIPSSYTVLDAINTAVALTVTDLSSTLIAKSPALVTVGDDFSTVPLVKQESPVTAADFVTIQHAFETQRDTTYAAAGISTLPLDSVVALATYNVQYTGFGARFPIRIDNSLYMIILTTHTYTDAETADAGFNNGKPKYDLDTVRIYPLIDNGRITATFDKTTFTITIPSVRVADNIFINAVLKLVASPDPVNAVAYPYIFELQDGFEQM